MEEYLKKFEDLEIGDFFKLPEIKNLYIKTDEIKKSDGHKINAVNISNGSYSRFFGFTLIERWNQEYKEN